MSDTLNTPSIGAHVFADVVLKVFSRVALVDFIRQNLTHIVISTGILVLLYPF